MKIGDPNSLIPARLNVGSIKAYTLCIRSQEV